MRDGAAAPREMKGTGMGFQHYEEKDYDAVCDFLTALNEKDGLHVNWNWARFEWMAEHPEFDKSLSASIGLWTEEGRIVGAAIYDMYFGEASAERLRNRRMRNRLYGGVRGQVNMKRGEHL